MITSGEGIAEALTTIVSVLGTLGATLGTQRWKRAKGEKTTPVELDRAQLAALILEESRHLQQQIARLVASIEAEQRETNAAAAPAPRAQL